MIIGLYIRGRALTGKTAQLFGPQRAEVWSKQVGAAQCTLSARSVHAQCTLSARSVHAWKSLYLRDYGCNGAREHGIKILFFLS